MSRPQTVVSGNHQRSIISRYTKKGEGLVEIGKALGYSIPIIRRVLTAAKVKIRKRGRPRVA